MTQVTGQTSELAVRASEPAAGASKAAEKLRPQNEKIEFGSERAGFNRVDFTQAVVQIQKFIDENPKVNLSIYVDDTINRPVMRVVDPQDGEIMQIPAEEVIKIAENIDKMRGVFFDRKA